jgi:AhpD family alkylhydroperoxidase
MAKQRLSAATIAPDGYKALIGVETYIRRCGLEQQLIELAKMRASQINGCAYCLDMHSRDARRAGESEQRLYLLDAWHEASVYTPRERAALAWTEAVTRIADTHAPDDAYEALRTCVGSRRQGQLGQGARLSARIGASGWALHPRRSQLWRNHHHRGGRRSARDRPRLDRVTSFHPPHGAAQPRATND